MNAPVPSKSVAEQLCLTCGLCCDGTIFADVRLQPKDNAEQLKSLGLQLSDDRPLRFKQPCAALDGCRCTIYRDRPNHCRAFDCFLLQKVKAGRLEPDSASRVIREALRKVTRVRRLLSELGDVEQKLPLQERFRRTAAHIEALGADPETADRYGRLTLAYHDLIYLLSKSFYSVS